jgi:hypothetical protein
VQRECACGGSAGLDDKCEDCRQAKLTGQPAPIQHKLRIGPADDHYERQADRVADTVMRMPAAGAPGFSIERITPLVQRQPVEAEEEEAQTKPLQRQPVEEEEEELQTKRIQRQPVEEEEEEEALQTKRLQRQPVEQEEEEEVQTSRLQRQPLEEEEEEMQMKRAPGGGSANHTRLAGTHHGGGQPLPATERAFFESRLGSDFSGVRVHTDSRAAASARAVGARAYTVGRNVVFGAGQWAPRTERGRRLIAHELTHVVQQGKAGRSAQLIQRAARPRRERVWGFWVNRRMCGCGTRLRDSINWANTARDTYRACDVSSYTTGTEVEDCFDRAHPGTVVAGETSASGDVTLPPPSRNPCQRIENRGTWVHETFHARQANRIARSLGRPFWRAWHRLRGTRNRLRRLRGRFPSEVTRFNSRWNSAREWVDGEVESYTWERRFLTDVRRALRRICT